MEVSLSHDDATVYYTSLRKDNRRRRNTRRKTAARHVPLSAIPALLQLKINGA